MFRFFTSRIRSLFRARPIRLRPVPDDLMMASRIELWAVLTILGLTVALVTALLFN